MKKREFLDLLRFYLKDMPNAVTEDIISDYEEHFAIAEEKGKTEEEICRELGSPEAIAKEYISGEKIHLVPVNAENEDSGNKSGINNNGNETKKENKTHTKEDNKKTTNIILGIVIILAIFFFLPPIFGVGFGIVGLVIGIVGLILGIVFSIFWGIISLILGIFNFGISLILSVLGAVFSFLPFNFYYTDSFSNIFLNINPLTGFFAALTAVAFGVIVVFFGILLIKFLVKTIKNIFITIKWKKRRKDDEKSSKNSDYSDVDM